MDLSLISATNLFAVKGDKLRGPAQWSSWYMRIKRFAQMRKVWELCNPEIAADALPKPREEPIVPEYPKDGDDEERQNWRCHLEIYKFDLDRHERQAIALCEVYEYILATLDSKYHQSVIGYKTPYEVLVALKTRFAGSNYYREELRDKWDELACQKPGKDIDQWIGTWDTVRHELIRLGIQVDDEEAVRCFIRAITKARGSEPMVTF